MKRNKKVIIWSAVASASVLVFALLVWGPLGESSKGTRTALGARDHDEDHDQEGEHEGHEGHEGEHEEHEDHEGHQGENVVRLSQEEEKKLGIGLATAAPGSLNLHVELPGEIALNADRLAHVVPRISGIVSRVYKKLGDEVKSGEVMAAIESRELADSKAGYLAACERLALARANFKREEGLWKKKITSEQEYLDARRAEAEARIVLRSAKQKLHALGLSKRFIANMANRHDRSFTRYSIIAPIDGEVIKKHITLGEVLKDDSEVFVVADLSSVWVDINVYPTNISSIRKGQTVVVKIGYGIQDFTGDISYVGPLVGESTRTSLARVVIPNPDRILRPGMFVTAKVILDEVWAPVVIQRSALLIYGKNKVVFVQTAEGFEPRPVELGRSTDTLIEITSGLTAGEHYIDKGAFELKAKLVTSDLGGHAGHGH